MRMTTRVLPTIVLAVLMLEARRRRGAAARAGRHRQAAGRGGARAAARARRVEDAAPGRRSTARWCSYTATAGWLILKNDEGKPIARFGYTAYTRDGVERPRAAAR